MSSKLEKAAQKRRSKAHDHRARLTGTQPQTVTESASTAAASTTGPLENVGTRLDAVTAGKLRAIVLEHPGITLAELVREAVERFVRAHEEKRGNVLPVVPREEPQKAEARDVLDQL